MVSKWSWLECELLHAWNRCENLCFRLSPPRKSYKAEVGFNYVLSLHSAIKPTHTTLFFTNRMQHHPLLKNPSIQGFKLKRTLLAASLIFFGSSQAYSKTLYIECKFTEVPSHTSAYAKLTEKQRSDFIMESIEKGVLRNIITPSSSWVINTETGRISSPDNEENEFIEKAKITSGTISGALKNGNTFTLNRINGTLKISSTHAKQGITLVGIPIENLSTWTSICSSKGSPAI